MRTFTKEKMNDNKYYISRQGKAGRGEAWLGMEVGRTLKLSYNVDNVTETKKFISRLFLIMS